MLVCGSARFPGVCHIRVTAKDNGLLEAAREASALDLRRGQDARVDSVAGRLGVTWNSSATSLTVSCPRSMAKYAKRGCGSR
jgi:hypothetical protein